MYLKDILKRRFLRLGFIVLFHTIQQKSNYQIIKNLFAYETPESNIISGYFLLKITSWNPNYSMEELLTNLVGDSCFT